MENKSAVLIVLVIVLELLSTGCSGREANLSSSNTQVNQEKNADLTKGEGTERETVKIIDGEENKNDSSKISVDVKQNGQNQSIEMKYSDTDIKAQVPNYSIERNLSNIVNLEQFGTFSDEQLKKLEENGFIVCPSEEEQLFYVYEKNEYKTIPSFITVDSVLQVYHVFYDYFLRNLESNQLMDPLKELTENMLQQSIKVYERIENKSIKSIQLKNIAFFATAHLCIGELLPEAVPQAAAQLAKDEYDKIINHEGFAQSSIFTFDLDYSQYIPRGHYTRSDLLKKYFITMMWYGQAPMPLYKTVVTNGQKEIIRAKEETLQAILMTHTLFRENASSSSLWETIYEPTSFLVGDADDLNVFQYKEIIQDVYGTDPNVNQFDKEEKLDLFYAKADELPAPKIAGKYTAVTTPVGKQFRFMGQRYIADSEIIQNLVEPLKRPIPSGLDIMAVLGSSRAKELLDAYDQPEEKWKGYAKAFEEMKQQFDSLAQETWQSNMYYGWLWTLQGLLKSFGEGYPQFMQNTAWMDRSLQSALGSWAELRHDTVLYGKQSGAECGGGDIAPIVKSYVEPNIEVYSKLLWLTQYARENLKQRNILSQYQEQNMNNFEELLEFLIICSKKELNNEELTEDQYNELLTYGGRLESLTCNFAGEEDQYLRWFEITSETDKNMAIIADVHTIAPNEFSSGGYLEAGVGPAQEIFVVVPIQGELYLTRGAVFGYYEFVSQTNRLTDEQWQSMLENKTAPSQPQWIQNLIQEPKEEIPVPKEPYYAIPQPGALLQSD